MGLENIRYITGFYWDWTDILVDSKLVNIKVEEKAMANELTELFFQF